MRRLFLIALFFSGFARAAEPELLDPAQAFRLSARALDGSTVEVTYKIAPGYYLYRERFRFDAKDSPARLGQPDIPQGTVKHDEFFGDVQTYRDEVRIRIPATGLDKAAPNLNLTGVSQGCADIGVCYPPLEQNVLIKLAGLVSSTAVASESGGGLKQLREVAGDETGGRLPAAGADALLGRPNTSSAAADVSEMDQIAGILATGRFWKVIGFFFVAGLLLALTPCVLPMVPIVSGIIAGQGGTITRSRAFGLSLAYVLGMAVTYAAAGVLAGLSGALLSTALQNPWVLSSFALIFVFLALSMFGLYELQLPGSLQASLSGSSNRLGGGRVLAVAAMGALSALIVGPCVAAPLAGALLYLAQTRDVVLGGTALFTMALGMGVPILLVGMSAGALLPKAGPWMEAVKRFFGVLLLGVAIWLISPVVPGTIVMLAWAALLIISSVFLRAIDSLPAEASGYLRLAKGVGVLQPLAGLRTRSEAPSLDELRFERIRSSEELDQRLTSAGGKYVMLDFYADWCVSCKEMERFTFTDPQVRARLKDVLLLQADVTENSAQDKALLKRFGLFGPPGIILFRPDGTEIRAFRVVGYKPSEEFLAHLARAMPQG
jgi:thioredoxin:protein disulfide reductase